MQSINEPYTREYQICTKTVMDTIADPHISFDEAGICNYIREHADKVRLRVPDPLLADNLLQHKLETIKKRGKRRAYDCVVGISGGIDSTYALYLTKKFGLRPLAVHVDNGWNSELAVNNIKKVLDTLDVELHTTVLPWDEFKDIQRSFLKASTPDAEIPTDHAIYAVIYKAANRYNIPYIITGTNMRTEGIMPKSWASGHLDWRYIRSVQKEFGSRRATHFPKITLQGLAYFLLVKRIQKFSILDYAPYSKKEASSRIQELFRWTDYGGKHYESIYTRFFQGYILPEKFGIDKRKCHLSNLILSGEITRDQALKELKQPPYADEKLLRSDREFVLKKLEISESEFQDIMKAPSKTIYNYPNQIDFIRKLNALWNKISGLRPLVG